MYIDMVIFSRLNTEFHNIKKIELTKTEDRILQKCFELSAKSTHYRAKVASMIYEKNRIISIGVNSNKSHPFADTYGTYKSGIHAELKAILDVSKLDFNPDKSTIFIARRSNHRLPNPGCSYPCRYCWNAIKEVGIRKIICYDIDGKPCKVDMK